jgi:hypothetical protein
MLVINEKLTLNSEKDLVLIHLYIKSLEKNIPVSEGVRELLYELYKLNGVLNKDEYDEFSKACVKNTSITTLKSVRNTLSKCVKLGIVENIGKYNKKVSEKWIPNKNITDTIGLNYKIIDINVLKKTTA